jgi:hypothetical protein
MDTLLADKLAARMAAGGSDDDMGSDDCVTSVATEGFGCTGSAARAQAKQLSEAEAAAAVAASEAAAIRGASVDDFHEGATASSHHSRYVVVGERIGPHRVKVANSASQTSATGPTIAAVSLLERYVTLEHQASELRQKSWKLQKARDDTEQQVQLLSGQLAGRVRALNVIRETLWRDLILAQHQLHVAQRQHSHSTESRGAAESEFTYLDAFQFVQHVPDDAAAADAAQQLSSVLRVALDHERQRCRLHYEQRICEQDSAIHRLERLLAAAKEAQEHAASDIAAAKAEVRHELTLAMDGLQADHEVLVQRLHTEYGAKLDARDEELATTHLNLRDALRGLRGSSIRLRSKLGSSGTFHRASTQAIEPSDSLPGVPQRCDSAVFNYARGSNSKGRSGAGIVADTVDSASDTEEVPTGANAIDDFDDDDDVNFGDHMRNLQNQITELEHSVQEKEQTLQQRERETARLKTLVEKSNFERGVLLTAADDANAERAKVEAQLSQTVKALASVTHERDTATSMVEHLESTLATLEARAGVPQLSVAFQPVDSAAAVSELTTSPARISDLEAQVAAAQQAALEADENQREGQALVEQTRLKCEKLQRQCDEHAACVFRLKWLQPRLHCFVRSFLKSLGDDFGVCFHALKHVTEDEPTLPSQTLTRLMLVLSTFAQHAVALLRGEDFADPVTTRNTGVAIVYAAVGYDWSVSTKSSKPTDSSERRTSLAVPTAKGRRRSAIGFFGPDALTELAALTGTVPPPVPGAADQPHVEWSGTGAFESSVQEARLADLNDINLNVFEVVKPAALNKALAIASGSNVVVPTPAVLRLPKLVESLTVPATSASGDVTTLVVVETGVEQFADVALVSSGAPDPDDKRTEQLPKSANSTSPRQSVNTTEDSAASDAVDPSCHSSRPLTPSRVAKSNAGVKPEPETSTPPNVKSSIPANRALAPPSSVSTLSATFRSLVATGAELLRDVELVPELFEEVVEGESNASQTLARVVAALEARWLPEAVAVRSGTATHIVLRPFDTADKHCHPSRASNLTTTLQALAEAVMRLVGDVRDASNLARSLEAAARALTEPRGTAGGASASVLDAAFAEAQTAGNLAAHLQQLLATRQPPTNVHHDAGTFSTHPSHHVKRTGVIAHTATAHSTIPGTKLRPASASFGSNPTGIGRRRTADEIVDAATLHANGAPLLKTVDIEIPDVAVTAPPRPLSAVDRLMRHRSKGDAASDAKAQVKSGLATATLDCSSIAPATKLLTGDVEQSDLETYLQPVTLLLGPAPLEPRPGSATGTRSRCTPVPVTIHNVQVERSTHGDGKQMLTHHVTAAVVRQDKVRHCNRQRFAIAPTAVDALVKAPPAKTPPPTASDVSRQIAKRRSERSFPARPQSAHQAPLTEPSGSLDPRGPLARDRQLQHLEERLSQASPLLRGHFVNALGITIRPSVDPL